MSTHRRPLSPLAVLLLGLSLLAPPPAHAQSHTSTCIPANCLGTFHGLGFESLVPGTSVEGPGAVDPDLVITSVPWALGPSCPAGSAQVIVEGSPVPYPAYTAGATNVPNDCLTGTHGFADDQSCVLDYDFTFAPGVTVNCFGIRILDYGDYFPFGGTTHQVLLTAYDASNAVVDTDVLLVSGGEDLTGGDACVSQASQGNVRLEVAGAGIVKIKLTYDAFPDPNVGYDDVSFCKVESPTPNLKRTWGSVKRTYR